MKNPIFYFTYMILAITMMCLSGCDKDDPDVPSSMVVDPVYSFGDNLNSDEGLGEYFIANADAQDIELKLYEKDGDKAPVESFRIFQICDYDPIEEETDFINTIHWANYPWDKENGGADIAQGGTAKYRWTSISGIVREGEPMKLIVHLPENNTGKVRGIRIVAANHMYGNIWFCGSVMIFQLPRQNKADTFLMKIRYKGELYESMASLDNEGNLIYEDKQFSDVINKLEANPNIDMVIMDDEIVDYYDSDDPKYVAFINTVNRKVSIDRRIKQRDNIPETRANGFQFWDPSNLGYFALFDNDYFEGQSYYHVLDSFHYTWNLPDLKRYDMNDKVTSLAIRYGGDDPEVCAVLTLWEDTDYNNSDNNIPRKKHRISLVATYDTPRVSRVYLKNVKLINSSGTWNDRISSISFHFGYYGRNLVDY